MSDALKRFNHFTAIIRKNYIHYLTDSMAMHLAADDRITELEVENDALWKRNRLAVAEAYRCGFEAGKVESDLWGEAATTIKELEAELDTFRDASLLLTGKLEDAEAELAALRELLGEAHGTLAYKYKAVEIMLRHVLNFDPFGPCPICNGIEGCAHTRNERLKAAIGTLRDSNDKLEADLRSVLARRTAALDEAHKTVNKHAALREAAGVEVSRQRHLCRILRQELPPTTTELASLLQESNDG